MIPILYSFRRCPYAMRARLAIAAAGQKVELREVVLRDKPQAFLSASPSATVPCLVTGAGVIDESLDIMKWALDRSDPNHWLAMPEEGWGWIERADGPFKRALDRTKYAARYPDEDPAENRDAASEFLQSLDDQIDGWLFDAPSIADFAILPFVRQFAYIDKAWFDDQPWPSLSEWLERFLASDRLAAVMRKYPQWVEGNSPMFFVAD
ncbi:glutathione S-transferase [Qingshengfaniella alkalisoli]|uniref:Glutathione S-transferase n=1 Tax=Qingshengfaniella alkalisoli TaxID=2599296 RepID=A0A5B8IC14_9RHOB|nr:glutathione S-transferase [Qingshengfaniella alkalisoli]QDY71066.1 glutathione S-transferase [Qingshengfaniella alkalisoli]